MRNSIRRIGVALGAIWFTVLGTGAWAQVMYPDRPIKIIVPWLAGGSVDFAVRILAEQLSVNLGQPVIVDNRPGAAGNIGAAAASKATPDGYTLLIATTPMIINRHIYKNLPFDLSRDFTPISQLIKTNYLLVGRPSGIQSVPELLAKAKASPGKISYASSGAGTQNHLIGEGFKRQASINIVHVPYKGGPQALADLLGGHVDLMVMSLPLVEPLIKSGQVKALAVASKHRLAQQPDVPTLTESGVPNLDDFTEWYGVVAPAGTPDKIVDRLNNEIVKILKMPDVRQRLVDRGFTPHSSTAQEFSGLIQAEEKKWATTVKQLGIQMD